MTLKDKTKAIRQALKEHGWNSHQVSVRGKYFSISSSIRVIIKDSSVPLYVVKEIVCGHEEISRCSVTNEILGGGNTFITVEYSSGARKELAAPYLLALKKATVALPKTEAIIVEPVGQLDNIYVGWAQPSFSCYAFHLWIENQQDQMHYDTRNLEAAGVALALHYQKE